MKNNRKKSNTPSGIYIPSETDRERYEAFRARFLTSSNNELVDDFNRQKAIYGVRAQMIFLYALHHVFLERFGISPIINEDSHSFSLGKKIYYSKALNTILPVEEN